MTKVQRNKTERAIYVPRYASPKKQGASYYIREFGPTFLCAALLVGAVYVFKNGFVDTVVRPAEAYSTSVSRDISDTNAVSNLEKGLE